MVIGGIWHILQRRPATVLFAAVVVFGAVWFTFLPMDSSVTSDDGAYALEVRQLEEGRWSVPHPLAAADPGPVAYPYQNSTITDEGYFPGARHAVWVRVLAIADRFAGLGGMRALPLIGLVTAAIAAVTMGRHVHDSRTGAMAGVFVVASPLLFDALQLWAHAVVAGSIAICALGSLRLADGERSWTACALVAAGAAGASALRGDGLIFALAVGLVLGLSGLRSRDGWCVFCSGVVGVVALGSYAGAALYARSIVGRADAVGATSARGGGTMAGRLRGVVQTFLSSDAPAGALLLLVLALALSVVAVFAIRRRDGEAVTVLFGVAAAVWIVRTVVFPTEMASGLVAAWPVIAFVLARRWRDLEAGDKRLLAIGGLAALGIALTQYDQGGGLNWGGRFLSASVPMLAVVAAGGFSSVLRRDQLPLRSVAVSFALLVMASLAGSLVFDAGIRTRHDRIIERVAGVTVPVVTASEPLPRIVWRTFPNVEWLLMPRSSDGSTEPEVLLDLLNRADIDSVVLYGISKTDAAVIAGHEIVADTESKPLAVPVDQASNIRSPS